MNTKRQDKVLPLLLRQQGASVDEMAEVAGIEERKVHAVLSILRAAGHYRIASTMQHRTRVYRATPVSEGAST